MPDLAVTAIGRDRPGIVAAVTGSLLEVGGNVEDSQMSNLGGHFAVMLLVRVPGDVGREVVSERLAGVAMSLELDALSVAEVGEGGRAARATHVLSVYGADHPGIVHTITSTLAESGVNITDLETKLTGGKSNPVYVMVVEVDLGASPADPLERTLKDVAEQAGIDMSLRELDTEVL